MPLPYMELFIQPQPVRVSSYVHLWPCLRTLVEYSDHQAIALKFYCQNFRLKCLSTRFALASSGTRLNPVGAFPLATKARESSNANVNYGSNSNTDSHCNAGQYEVGAFSGHHYEPDVTCNMEKIKETERRRKIGLANRGRVPWNKGKKHSPETLARIRERTLEALSDPKVRRKMSNTQRMHSAQSKERISSSLKQLWAKRLKWKRSKEKLYSSWAGSIAEAARRGGINEEELTWNSYQQLKEEIASRHLQRAAKKAKEKETRRTRAEKRALEKAKKMVPQVRKKMVGKEKAITKAKQRRRSSSRTRVKKEKPTASRKSNKKARLTKANGKKNLDGTFCNQVGVMLYLQSALERLDIESIKKELGRSTVSLADQIQAAKRKRTEAIASGSVIRTSLQS